MDSYCCKSAFWTYSAVGISYDGDGLDSKNIAKKKIGICTLSKVEQNFGQASDYSLGQISQTTFFRDSYHSLITIF